MKIFINRNITTETTSLIPPPPRASQTLLVFGVTNLAWILLAVIVVAINTYSNRRSPYSFNPNLRFTGSMNTTSRDTSMRVHGVRGGQLVTSRSHDSTLYRPRVNQRLATAPSNYSVVELSLCPVDESRERNLPSHTGGNSPVSDLGVNETKNVLNHSGSLEENPLSHAGGSSPVLESGVNEKKNVHTHSGSQEGNFPLPGPKKKGITQKFEKNGREIPEDMFEQKNIEEGIDIEKEKSEERSKVGGEGERGGNSWLPRGETTSSGNEDTKTRT